MRKSIKKTPMLENFIPFNVVFESWFQVLKDIRELYNLTQVHLGKELGYNDKQISRFEKGTVEPPLEFWKKFSDKFDVNPQWLMFGIGSPTKNLPSDPSLLVNISTKHLETELKERRQMADSYRKLAKTRKDEIVNREASTMGYDQFRNKLKEEIHKVIPANAPQWLKDDLQDIHLL